MHEFASFNCSTVGSSDPRLAALSSAALYGKGIFTTIAVHDSKPLFWDKHWRRLTRDASRVGIDLDAIEHTGGPVETVTSKALEELLGANRVGAARARITFFDETAGELWPYRSTRKTSLLITTADLQPAKKDLKLTLSPFPIDVGSPLAGVKSCNYLDRIMAKNEAKARGFNEAVQTNQRGEISSACMANIFWLKNGKLFTPSLETGCLPGTTREFVLENLECEEVEVGIDMLQGADEMFLTSAGLGVAQVAGFDGRALGRADHPILNLLPRRE